ncbi:hypothetical protein PQX77_015241 [Marasmius sp. AFHP31]|nr:hypothetical protein PQX77_015241 [Marasmius sp. AFHP31]
MARQSQYWSISTVKARSTVSYTTLPLSPLPGYIYGNPRTWPCDHWARQSPNVVIVSVYDRLNAFSFLTTSDFADSRNGDFNAGFPDQIQALQWVKIRIEPFGGGPVEHHLVANVKERLFSGPIAQSVYRASTLTPEQQRPLFEISASTADCALVPGTNSTPWWHGKVIVGNPSTLVNHGKSVKVPLIVGYVVLGFHCNLTINLTTVRHRMKLLPEGWISQSRSFSHLSDKDSPNLLAVALEAGFASSSQCFQVVPGESLSICASTPAVNHATENWMILLGSSIGSNGTAMFTPQTPVELAFTEEVFAYWVFFVRAGDTNKSQLPKSPEWLQYARVSKRHIVLHQDRGNWTTQSGSFVEKKSVTESRRCEVVASKSVQEQY